MAALELDPRWEWIHCPPLGEPPSPSDYIKGQCNHLEVEPIRDLDGDLVAQLCTTCDQRWYAGKTLDEV
jgi:hypothetical protein